MKLRRVCIVPELHDRSGGPASFYRKLSAGLQSRGVEVANGFDDQPYDAVLVINATRQLARLLSCRRKGIRIVQRLGAVNWLHRCLPVGPKEYVLSEVRNLTMRLVRSSLADHIVYQSRFVQDWWAAKFGPQSAPSTVIYNGVDLAQFDPSGPRYESPVALCLMSVEGTQGADPFDIAISLGRALEQRDRRLEVLMFGDVWPRTRSRFGEYPFVNFKGSVPNAELPIFYRGASLFVATDIITAGCPNSVIEALACGVPVLGYDVGVFPELVPTSAGRPVKCHGNPWSVQPPGNLDGLAEAALQLVEGGDAFRQSARRVARERFGLDQMVDGYMRVLEE